jgi:FAD/FMN-containing dehydrogenase
VLTVSEGSEDYLAARVSLGALRVVSQVTLQTVPLYTLIRRGERRALTKTLERLDEFVDDNDHFDFFLFPYGETALTRTTCHTYEELTPTPLEVRFSAPDDAFLSTAHGRDTCYIAVHQYSGMEFETYFRAVEAIMDDYAGRPHWGKRHYQTGRTLRERYPEWDRFGAVRDRVDPDRVFVNDHTRRVLGNGSSPSRHISTRSQAHTEIGCAMA